MSSSTAPSTSGTSSSVNPGVLRRSFTVPAKVTDRPKPTTSNSDSDAGIETLFTHTFAKIVSFSTALDPSRPPTANGRRPSVNVQLDADTPGLGSIPWESVTERTLAAGPVRIYRVTASNVSFLNSGRLLHTIFPKSQCWCVDGECKFVLRVRQDSYYRIELPCATDEDKAKIEDFKTVLAKVLQYEKTASPFKIGLEVGIPEQPEPPIPKRLRRPSEKAKKWLFDKSWVPEDGPKPLVDASDSAISSSYDDDDRESVQTIEEKEESSKSPLPRTENDPPLSAMRNLGLTPPPSLRQRAKTFMISRSITAPPRFGLGQSSPLAARKVVGHLAIPESEAEHAENVEEAISRTSSVDSFYSLAKTQSRTPTPPFEDATSIIESNSWAQREEQVEHKPHWRRGRHRRRISDLTVTAHSRTRSEERLPSTPTDGGETKSAPSTPPLMSDSDDSFEPPLPDVPTPPDAIRLKKLTGASQRRAYSPMPHPQNLFNPPSHAPQQQFTAALVQKTCQLLLGPPAHLVALMLRIAAHISNGAFGFGTYRVHQETERIPCSWESSDDGDEWAEDDFGIPLGHLEPSGLRRREPSSHGSWEVD
ncbi:uncharacterized protein BDZ99DRAFT_392342 [Mytilinidion resinicola]|uniref:Inheritance of peroxisomes protein 1 n=1 Tax=Mytilinidion resinicola TaxID=574789 RepID=A0A6A6YIE0_9PEZI|nr:uncharacterized protein BDZ99DRAFT_392342 [Mytilinidion resinicola]KAF2807735.1 hypothetical protein BDZ99DRAFT_392342 [Mytilinidion resinicola]